MSFREEIRKSGYYTPCSYAEAALDHLPIITTTAGLVSNALSSIKSARELAKGVSDNDLKEQIGAAYDTLQDLREHAHKLDEENRLLKTQLAEKTAYIGPVAPHGYFYAATDEQQQHPLCPACFQKNPQQIAFMNDAHAWNDDVRRKCKICKNIILEMEAHRSQSSPSPLSHSSFL